MPNKHKGLLLCLALSAALTVTMAGAAGMGGAAEEAFPAEAPGKTTVGVAVGDADPAHLSFTVPLYVTVATTVKDGIPTVVCPDNYTLRNTTPAVDDVNFPRIAVTALTVERVPGAAWSLTESAPTGDKQLQMKLGGLPLPATPGPDPVAVNLRQAGSPFWTETAYTPILSGPDAAGLHLPLSGALAASYTQTEAAAAPQFKLKYTVSLLDAGGTPIGVVYTGPTEEDATVPVIP